MSLLAYLAPDRLRALAEGRELPQRANGAVLVADVSGFTALTERLTEQHGERGGVEALATRMTAAFDRLLAAVDAWGGSTVGFAGDAVTCWFEAGGEAGLAGASAAAGRALGCALAMQRHGRGDDGLSLRVGLACGPVQRLAVGDPAVQRLDVLGGAVLDRAHHAGALARPGEVVVDDGAAAALGALGAACVAALQARGDVTEGFRPVEPNPALEAELEATREGWRRGTAPDTAPARAAADTAAPTERLAPWLPPLARERDAAGAWFATDLRPAIALFVGFEALDFDAPGDEAARALDRLVRHAQGVLAAHGGALLELTLGDKGQSLYACFGAGQAHEDDPERAARAALDLRRGLEALGRPARIGMARGTLRVGGYGGEQRRSFAAQGDAVNAAARLMARARPGEVLVSGRLRAALAEGFVLEAREPMPLKGKAEPTPVYALGAPRVRRALRLEAAGSALPLVGRAAELKALMAQFDQARAGQGGLAVIVAEAGLGKSRLADEALRLALHTGAVGYAGEAQDDGAGMPYRLWPRIAAALFDVDPTRPPRSRLRALEAAVARRAPAHADAWPLLLPLLGPILALPPGGEGGGLPAADSAAAAFTAGLHPRDRKAVLESLLLAALAHEARELHADGAVMLLLLEDLHAADAASLDLLLALRRRAVDLPLWIVATRRPLDAPPSGAEPDAATGTLAAIESAGLRIELGVLGDAEVEQLVRAKFASLFPERQAAQAGRLPAALLAHLVQRAEGNPFHAEQMLEALRDRGIDPRDATTGSALDWPPSLHSLVLSRIDRLPVGPQRVLKLASVAGLEFEAELLRGCLDDDAARATLDADLAELARRSLLRPLDDERLRFGHAVTQAVAYHSLEQGTRVVLHRLCADTLRRLQPDAAARRAHHLLRGDRPAAAVPQLWRSAEQAAAVHANPTALAALDELRALLPGDAIDARMLLALRREALNDRMGRHAERQLDVDTLAALASAGKDAPSTGTVRGATPDMVVALAELPAAPPRALWAAWGALRRAALALDLGDAVRAFDQAQAAATSAPDGAGGDEARRLRIEAGVLAARAALAAGRIELARSGAEHALASAEALGSPSLAARALTQLGLVEWQAGRYDAAESLLGRALQGAGGDADPRRRLDVLNNLGVLARSRSRLADAQAHYAEALPLARRIGDRSGEAMLLNNLGTAGLSTGDFEHARRCAESAAALYRELGESAFEAVARLNGAEAQRELGQLDAARRGAETALEALGAGGLRRGEAAALENLGLIAAAEGRLADARAAYDRARQIAREIGARSVEASILLHASQAHRASGDQASAIADLQAAIPMLADLGEPRARLEARLAQASLAPAADDAPALRALLADADTGEAAALPPALFDALARHLHGLGDPHAAALHRRARESLAQRLARIEDAATRRSFLALPEHAALRDTLDAP